MRQLDAQTEKRIDRQLRRGDDVERVIERLAGKGWDPGDAREAVEDRDRVVQDAMRETNMQHTHAPQYGWAKTGGGIAGGLIVVWLILRLLRLVIALS